MAILFEGKAFALLPGETVLQGIERQGGQVPSFCRRGICQACVLKARKGSPPALAQKGLKEAFRRQSFFLSCVCEPAEDLEIERCGVSERFPSRIERVEPLSGDVLRVLLRVPDGFVYAAGQYVQVERLEDGLMRPYSIASLASAGQLELHVARLPGGALSGWLPSAVGRAVGIRGPFGECAYVEGEIDRPLLLAGTGTGLAPLLGVVRAALAAGHRAPIRLFHGSLTRAGLYLWSELERLARETDTLRVVGSVLGGDSLGVGTDPGGGTSGEARSAVVGTPIDQLVLGSGVAWREQRVYLCGHHELVQKLQKKIYIAGAPLERIHADPFVAPGARA
jgi:CDP-4-dehydro-6-deoxyglucose reductase, E3